MKNLTLKEQIKLTRMEILNFDKMNNDSFNFIEIYTMLK